MSDQARDVLAYLGWWDYMLWREQHRQDPTVEWQPDLSWDECAELAGIPWGEGAGVAPGDVPANVELAVELYWPGRIPVPA